MPSSWKYYNPTIFDVMTFVGSLGVFMTLFLLFLRFLPMIAMFEVKGVLPQANPHWEGYGQHHDGHHEPHRQESKAHKQEAELAAKGGH